MNEEAAFLRAICEHPDDDTPRLVFADWLTEQGGPVNTAWANGIRAQVWLARGATDEGLRFQTCVFDSPFGQRKLRERLELPPGVGGWDRGFPCDAAGAFDDLRSLWPGLAFRIPIRKLSVYEASKGDTAEFVTWPALPRLRELEYVGAGPTTSTRADVIPVLADCAGLRGLKVLRAYNLLVTDTVVTAILDSPHLAGLETLHLDISPNLPAISDAARQRLVARFSEGVFENEIPF